MIDSIPQIVAYKVCTEILLHVGHGSNLNTMFGIQYSSVSLPVKMQKRNILKKKPNILVERNEFICLVIIFNVGVMITDISKITHFLYFMLMTAKGQFQQKQKVILRVKLEHQKGGFLQKIIWFEVLELTLKKLKN